MIDIGVDFELFWDKGYSLESMPTAEYVLDPRFEIIGVSVRLPDGTRHWVSGDMNHVRAELLRLVPDWSAVRVVAHNARLEASILEWRLLIKPGGYFCTMVGARPHVLPYSRSVSLDAVARYLGVGTKGEYVHKTKGMHRSDFAPEGLADFGEYCINDTVLTYGIAQKLLPLLPQDEQDLLDLTIKKFVRPQLVLSRLALHARLQDIQKAKETLGRMLDTRFGATIKDIRSRTKFPKLLANRGVEPPTKINKKGKTTHAFAKDDLQFKSLLTHPDEEIRLLAGAKTALSSTLEESRIKRLITLAEIKGDMLPVPLVYYGAHPGRFSGDEEINLQNLPRVDIDKATGTIKKGHLRYAIYAPPGYVILAADFSNIEARIVATLAGEWGLVQDFAAGVDIYSKFASRIYGKLINKNEHPKERFVGKTCVLGLGYGMGWKKFQLRVAQEGIFLTDEEAKRIVYLYREVYPMIPKLWEQLDYLAATHLIKPDAMAPGLADMIFAHERVILPNGMPLIYPGLRRTGGKMQFNNRFGSIDPENGNWIWGGTFLENIAQALARIIAARAELKLARAGLPCALQVHDELVWVVPEAAAEKLAAIVARVMTESVEFLPALPIAVEVKHGKTYGDAK